MNKAVDIVREIDLTNKKITKILGDKQVHKLKLQGCFRCDKLNNSPDKCFHKLSECHTCKRKGHTGPKSP